MKRMILMATSYPYTAGVLAVIWISSAALVKIEDGLSLGTVLLVNAITTCFVAAVGFRR